MQPVDTSSEPPFEVQLELDLPLPPGFVPKRPIPEDTHPDLSPEEF